MTLTSATTKVSYSGDGSTTLFGVPYVFWESDDLDVMLTNTSGTETTQTRGTHYTVTEGSGLTGSITMITAPATGETLTIVSDVPLTQLTSLPVGGEFPAKSVEEELDQTVRRVQQIAEAVGRALKISFVDSSNSVDAGLPSISGEGGNFLRVTSAEDGTEWAEQTTTTAGSSNDAPQTVGTGAASAGTDGDFARGDHVHQLDTGALATVRLGLFHHYGGP